MKNETTHKTSGIAKTRLARIATGSFLAIMAIHIVVFTAIGLFTPAGWRLLWIFIIGLGIMLTVILPLKYLRKKRAAVKNNKPI
ncbi:MAG: hypothetical protein LIO77_02150 [Rikenellaceae bacterium]|nr:hypothetical protein [Rikenellaceae bacterium]